MKNSEIFLELYRNLEETLVSRYSDNGKIIGSVVVKYMNEDEGKKWRDELNTFREMRNMLSHHAALGGEPVFEPSDAVIDVMRSILYEAQHPPVAMSIAVPKESLTVCRESDRVSQVIEIMERLGYSHIPVIGGDVLAGVFSVGSIFSYFRMHGGDGFSSDMRVGDLWEFLPPSCHTTERFAFVSQSAPYSKLKQKFTAAGPSERRTAAVFVTDSGKESGVLLGMITPWDMIRYFSE